MKLLELLSLEKNSQILDLGCGTGYLASVLAEKVGPEGQVTAVDPDTERIKVARESYSCNNLRFLVASDKDFPKGKYDIVFSSDVIHWIKDKDTTFKRVYENLKPGGHFGFTIIDKHPIPEVLSQILHPFGPHTVQATWGSFHPCSAGDYENLATSAGFEVTHMDIRKRSFTFPNIDFFIDFFYGVFHGKFDRSSAVLDEVKKRYEGQSLGLDVPRLTAVLTKPLSSIPT